MKDLVSDMQAVQYNQLVKHYLGKEHEECTNYPVHLWDVKQKKKINWWWKDPEDGSEKNDTWRQWIIKYLSAAMEAIRFKLRLVQCILYDILRKK